MPSLKFTQKVLEKLPFEDGQVDYFDTTTPGFGLRVGKKSKSFFAQKKVVGKDTRKTVGKLGQYTLEEAREIVLDYIHEMRKGVNPTDREKEEKAAVEADKAKDMTLTEVLEDMLNVRRGQLKETTVKQYRQFCNVYLRDWESLPLRKVTREMVLARHREITSTGIKGKGASGSADLTFRYFRKIWNHADARWQDTFGKNPVKVLSDMSVWNKLPRRKRHVESHNIKRWYDAVLQIENPTMRDYLLLLLFTGMRKNEATGLRWDSVDFGRRSLVVKDTKNGESLKIPLNSYLYAFFTRRYEAARENDFVFPGGGKAGHMVEPRCAIETVEAATGLKFTSHDLRRTILGVATEISMDAFIKKALVNHTIAVRSEDITSDYVEITLARMRKPSEYLCQALLERCIEGVSDLGDEWE
jgi:integrase